MQCPKCNKPMEEIVVQSLYATVTIDRCTECKGLWFDFFEADLLKDDWMSEFLDSGDPKNAKKHEEMWDVKCPRCNTMMMTVNDRSQPHIRYEVCHSHGVFMDAGEFTDYKNKNVLDYFKDLMSLVTRV